MNYGNLGRTDTMAYAVLQDPCVRKFTKDIIRQASTKDPVDAIADIKLALRVLEEDDTP